MIQVEVILISTLLEQNKYKDTLLYIQTFPVSVYSNQSSPVRANRALYTQPAVGKVQERTTGITW